MQVILVPSDFSENSTTALQYAIDLNKILKAKLVLYHCALPPAGKLVHAITKEEKDNVLNIESQEKRALLKAQLSSVATDINQEIEIQIDFEPFVVESTLDAAKKAGASLIIIGAHGATAAKKIFFGSNTSEFISKSLIPILAIPDGYSYKAIDKIIFSTDLEDFKDEIMKIIPFADKLRSVIQVLYFDYGPGITGNLINNTEQLITTLDFKDVGLIIKPAGIEQTLISHISDALKTLDPGWLVMFTRERSFWDKIFSRSKTESLSYSLSYPLLSFRKD